MSRAAVDWELVLKRRAAYTLESAADYLKIMYWEKHRPRNGGWGYALAQQDAWELLDKRITRGLTNSKRI